jgi:peroxiredoxin Q/BCP
MARVQAVGVGDAAPDFTLPELGGGMLSLGDYRGKNPVVLFFYPKDHTSVCTAQACSFRDHFADFCSAGAEVIGVSGDSLSSHEQFARSNRLPFHLVSDADGSLRKLYGVARPLWLVPGRVTYVIDRQGVVRHVYSALFKAERHVLEAIGALAALAR